MVRQAQISKRSVQIGCAALRKAFAALAKAGLDHEAAVVDALLCDLALETRAPGA